MTGSFIQGTLSSTTAASKIGGNVDVLVMGKGIESAATAAAGVTGVNRVLKLDNDSLDAVWLRFRRSGSCSLSGNSYSHVLAPSSNHGKNYMPRVAALMDSALTDMTSVVSEDTFQRPMYAGNAIATVQMKDATKFILVRTTAFDKAEETGGSQRGECIRRWIRYWFVPVGIRVCQEVRPARLGQCPCCSVRGKRMKNGENFGMLEEMADKLGGAVGASRAAADAGYVPNELQVGQTGKVVAPDLYVVVGISGAIQHLWYERLEDDRGYQ